MGDEEFQKSIDIFANSLNSILILPVKIAAELSVDGIISASILAKALTQKNCNFSLSFYCDFNDKIIRELSLNPCDNIMIIGSNIKNIISIEHKNLFSISNNKLFISNTLNADVTLSAVFSSYLVAKQLHNPISELSYLTLIPFYDKNNELLSDILKESLESKKISKSKGFNIFGSNTRQFHKVLEYSIDPFLLGVSGYEENAINIIKEIGIGFKDDGFCSMIDLEEEDMNRFINILGINHNIKKEDIILFNSEEANSPLRDFREFKDFLQACVTLNRPSDAVAKCLGCKQIKNSALEILREYKLNIINALNLFFTESSSFTITKDNITLVNYGNKIDERILETVSSIIFKHNSALLSNRIIITCSTNHGKLKCCIPETCLDSDFEKLLTNLNIKHKIIDNIVSYYVDMPESDFLQYILDNLAKTKTEKIIS